MSFAWLIVGEPRMNALDNQGPWLLYGYIVCYTILAFSCLFMALMFRARRGRVVELIPRAELRVFPLLIGSLGLRYLSVLATLFVGVYWLDLFILALSTALGLAAAWVVGVRLIAGPRGVGTNE